MKNNLINIVNESNQFYPTPIELGMKLLEGFSLGRINTILEPSAGKGDLIKALYKTYVENNEIMDSDFNIDYIELDNNLRNIVKFNLSEESLINEWKDYEDLINKYWHSLSYSAPEEIQPFKHELKIIRDSELHMAGNDFLTYGTWKAYDLILMNPPFKNGDEHLLKALQFIERDGGNLACILNAETIKNPYSAKRRELISKLTKLNATIEYVSNSFINSEHQSNVEIAMIKIFNHKVYLENSDFYENMKKHIDEKHESIEESTDIIVSDFIEQKIKFYEIEIASTIAFVKEYYKLRNQTNGCVVSIEVGNIDTKITSKSMNDFINKVCKKIRYKHWKDLLNDPKFTGKLTSNLLNEYHNKLNTLVDYEFSKFNIMQISIEMNASMLQKVEETIVKVFDDFTMEHAWYPECKKTIHYYNGWKSNKAHKLDKKGILPKHFIKKNWTNTGTVFEYNTASYLADLEKVFDYLAGERKHETVENIADTLNKAEKEGNFKNIKMRYFDVDFYLKGTMHVKFTNQELLDKFNIYCSQKKGWLPPNYGKTTYTDMDNESQEVVKEFHKNNISEYENIVANSHKYLINNNDLLLLT